MIRLRPPTDKQLAFAASLGLNVKDVSFRVASAQIADALEIKAAQSIASLGLARAMKVQYVGPRDDMPSKLVVSTISTNGFVYFRGTPKYCRPWNLQRRN